MSALKPGWQRVKFGEIVRLGRDRCPDPVAQGIERYVGLEHLESGDLRVRSWGDVAEGTTFTSRFRSGQVLFGKRRAYQRKVAVADFEGVCSGDIYVFESADATRLLPELLPFICQTDAFFDYAVGTSAGSLSPRTNWSSLAGYEFALPPLNEQWRCAHALSAAEALLQTSDYAHGTARMAFHATLQCVCSSSMRCYKVLPLADVVAPDRPITYGILMPGTGFDGGVPVIKVKDFPNGEIADDDLLLTNPAIAYEYRRSQLRAGDLLVSIRGTIGRIAMVPLHLEGANITQDTARLSFPASISVQYMRAMLESADLQRRLRSNIPPPAPAGKPPAKAKPRPTIQGLNIGELRRVTVPIPPRVVQDRLADACESARTGMISAERRLAQARAVRARIVQDLIGAAS